MPDDPTKPEMLSAAALDEAAKLLFDPRLSDETKGRIARDLFPSLLLMARAAQWCCPRCGVSYGDACTYCGKPADTVACGVGGCPLGADL